MSTQPPPGAAQQAVPTAQQPGALVQQQPGDSYPARLEVDYVEVHNRWLPLVRWLLAVPHYFALTGVWIAALVYLIVAWFGVLFTGRYPEGAFRFLEGTLRYTNRVNGYLLNLTDQYPAFALADDPSYPVRLHIEYPSGGVERWRALLAGLLIIPYEIVALVVGWIGWICAAIAGWVILFTTRYPRGLFDWAVHGMRWTLRMNAYQYFMVKLYPPFEN